MTKTVLIFCSSALSLPITTPSSRLFMISSFLHRISGKLATSLSDWNPLQLTRILRLQNYSLCIGGRSFLQRTGRNPHCSQLLNYLTSIDLFRPWKFRPDHQSKCCLDLCSQVLRIHQTILSILHRAVQNMPKILFHNFYM